MPGTLFLSWVIPLGFLTGGAAHDDVALPALRIDEATGVRWYHDVAYVEGEEAHATKHRLDLLLPAEGKWRQGRPILIWIHGGGWSFGDKDDIFGLYTRYCRTLAEHGVATANVSYRLSPQFRHPAHIEDVAAATAWLIAHAQELGFDPKAVFVSGHSAGGHLAALLAVDHRWLEAHGLPRGSIAGALPSSGVFDLRALVEGNQRWLRAFAAEDTAEASPIIHVDAEDPPFVFFVEENGAFMRRQTRKMAEALREAGVDAKLVDLPGVNHVTMLGDLRQPQGLHQTETLRFIDRIVEPAEQDSSRPRNATKATTTQSSAADRP